MYKKLQGLLHVNHLFEASDNAYWDDPYISKNLLNSHLSAYLDSASRNFKFMDASIEFMKSIFEDLKVENICDFGCGPGLYCEAFSKMGLDVSGIDFSSRSIEYAKTSAQEKNFNIHYRNENYLEIQDESVFDFATLIYCDYGSLSKENRIKLLKNIHRSLKDGGHFLMDVFTVHKFMNIKPYKTVIEHDSKSFWYPKEHIEIAIAETYENFVALDKHVLISEASSKVIHRWYQYFTVEMLREEVVEAGFEVVSLYDDLKGSTLSQESDTLAILLKK